MRTFEIALSFFTTLTLGVLVIPRLRTTRGLMMFAPPLTAVIAGVQILVEGPRWQMVPAYVLTAVLLIIWLLRMVVPGKSWFKRRAARRFVVWPSVAASVLVLVTSIILPIALPVFHFPKPTGPYQIGTVTYHWTESRREIFSTNKKVHRQLMAQVWYPVTEDSSPVRALYVVGAGALSAGLAHALSADGLVHVPGWFFDDFKYVTTNAIPSAPMATEKARYPVLIYVTGLDGFRQASTFQVENLVSHGYVVVGIDQPYTSASVTFPDGQSIQGLTKEQVQPLINQSIAPSPRAPTLNGQPLEQGIVPYLAQDVSFTIDQLTKLNKYDPINILTGRLNLDHLGAFGVSLGALVVAEACHEDARLGACLMMDAAMPANVVRAGLTQPSMWLTRDATTMRLESEQSGGWTNAEIHQTLSTMQAVFSKSQPDSGYYVDIPGMFHVNFTDTPYWSPFTSELGITGPIDSQQGFNIVNAYSLAFFDKALGGRFSTLLNNSSKKYPEVKLEAK